MSVISRLKNRRVVVNFMANNLIERALRGDHLF